MKATLKETRMMLTTNNAGLLHQSAGFRTHADINHTGDFPRSNPVPSQHTFHRPTNTFDMSLFLSSEGYSKENIRMASFKSWPSHNRTNPSSLAEAGFYYTGEGAGDTVTCHACGVKIGNWNDTMIPMEEHKKASPTCQIVRNYYSVSNSNYRDFASRQLIAGIPEASPPPLTTTGYVRAEDMTKEENRLKTFNKDWPATCPVKPRDLAKAGFYYTGEQDKVICAYCKGRLLNWTIGDSAFGEHMRHFPRCKFLERLAREAEEKEVQGRRSQESTQSSLNSFEQQGSGITGPRPVETRSKMDVWKNSNSVKIVRELGISEDLITAALEELSLQGETDLETSPLLDIVFRLEDEKQPDGATAQVQSTTPRQNLEQCDDHQSIPDDKQQCQNVIMMDLDSEDEDDDGEEFQSLKRENDRLKQSTFCRLCKEAAADLLFLPCRHLASCHNCANDLSHCPACGTEILGTVKTYMS